MLENFLSPDYPDFKEHGTPLCAQTFPDAFFAEENEELVYRKESGKTYLKMVSSYKYEKEAKKICESCPYKNPCAEYAINDPSLVGIWGGTTDRSRKAIRRERLLGVQIKKS